MTIPTSVFILIKRQGSKRRTVGLDGKEPIQIPAHWQEGFGVKHDFEPPIVIMCTS